MTFSILWFLADFLKPKLEDPEPDAGDRVAGVACSSGPTYKVVKNIRQRGRLPDMKAQRVYITLVVCRALLAAFFFLPLPVSRVHETGLVQVSEGHRESVHVADTGILTEVIVHDGQWVERDMDLARFRHPQFEFERQQYEKRTGRGRPALAATQKRQAEAGGDPAARAGWSRLAGRPVRLEPDNAQLQVKQREIDRAAGAQGPAGRDGHGVPQAGRLAPDVGQGRRPAGVHIGDMNEAPHPGPGRGGRLPGDADQPGPGAGREPGRPAPGGVDPAVPPVGPAVHRADHQAAGHGREEPAHPAHQPGRRNVATKPGGDPNVHQPLVQTYLVAVEVEDPDETLTPGTLATVKIHLKWKSAAWWAWRSMASALDVGLW